MLTPGQVEQYRQSGYLVVEQVLGDAQVEALRQVADDWVEASRTVGANGDVFDLEQGTLLTTRKSAGSRTRLSTVGPTTVCRDPRYSTSSGSSLALTFATQEAQR